MNVDPSTEALGEIAVPVASVVPLGLFLGIAFVLGLLVGSFLNVVIHRLPRDESVVFPPSHCPACGAGIKPWDNVPVLSYVLLRGRCRSCGVGISIRYPLVELATGLLFASIAWRFGPTPESFLWMFFAAALFAAAMVDFDHQIIPDEISLGGLAVGLVGMPVFLFYLGVPIATALAHVAGGALLGGGLLWIVGFAHARLCAAMGRTFDHWPGEGEALPVPGSLDYWIWFPGLGFGDVKLLAMIGAFLGPVGVVVTILGSSIAGLLLGVGWLAVTRSASSPFGFAPAIVAGALIALLVPHSLFGLP